MTSLHSAHPQKIGWPWPITSFQHQRKVKQLIINYLIWIVVSGRLLKIRSIQSPVRCQGKLLSIYLSIYLPTYLPTYLSIHLYIPCWVYTKCSREESCMTISLQQTLKMWVPGQSSTGPDGNGTALLFFLLHTVHYV